MGLIYDTSVIIALERGHMDLKNLNSEQEVSLSAITVLELLAGAHKADSEKRKTKKLAFVDDLVRTFPCLPFDIEESYTCAKIRADLSKKGSTIGTYDLMIGATALANGLGVLTFNEKDFSRIPGLEVVSPQRIDA